MKIRNILVTGGAGFIGSHLIDRLVKYNYNVTCIDNLSIGNLDNLNQVENKIDFFKLDLNKVNDVEKIIRDKKIEVIFHYAATVGVKRTLENPFKVLADAEITHNLLESARKCNVERFIYASSSEVYGDPVEIPEKENGILNAKLPYAVTKLMCEKYCESYHSFYGLKTTSLRFFNVYGPRQESSVYGFVVGIFIKQALNKQPLTVIGDGKQTRDFMFVSDNVDASVRTLDAKKSFGKPINLGSGKETTILELANKINDITGNKKGVTFVKPREYEIMRRVADTRLMESILGFKPKVSLTDGLIRTVGGYKKIL